MIARTPDQLREYNARLKAQRDEEARLLYAQQQGIEIGEARGEAQGEARGIRKGQLCGQIMLLQQLLKQPVSADDQLAACSIEQLQLLHTELRQRLNLGDT